MFITITESHKALARMHGALLARILMGGFFLLAGISKIGMFDGVAGMIAGAGLPIPEVLAALTIALEIGGGLMIISGWNVACATGMLIVFTILATALFHGPNTWSDTDPTQQGMFMKNLAIIAGLIYMFAFGAGTGWSIKEK